MNTLRRTSADICIRWGPNAYHAFESVWSLLHKLSHWNHLAPSEIVRLLRESPRHQQVSPTLRMCHAWDPLTPRRIGKVLGLTDAHILLAECTSYDVVIDGVALSGTLPARLTLRYCPQCIRRGFHTALYQMPWIARCPIDRQPIQEDCPNCHSPIPYRADLDALSFAYGCTQCGTALWPDRDTGPSERGLSDQALARLSNWFFKQKMAKPGRFAGRALFALQRTPLVCDADEETLRSVPAWIDDVRSGSRSTGNVYFREPGLVHCTWDMNILRSLDADDLRRAAGMHPKYRLLRPACLRPSWRTRMSSEWPVPEKFSHAPRLANFEYAYYGFREFVQHELLSRHAHCFARAVDTATARAGKTFDCCPWVVAFDRWDAHWARYQALGATKWGSANLFSKEFKRPPRRRASGATIWAIDAYHAIELEYAGLFSQAYQKRVKKKWYRACMGHVPTPRRVPLMRTDIRWTVIVLWLLNQRLLESFSAECARLLLLARGNAPMETVPRSFFLLEFPSDEYGSPPVLHIWQHNLMRALRKASEAGCDGLWMPRSLTLPVTSATAAALVNQR